MYLHFPYSFNFFVQFVLDGGNTCVYAYIAAIGTPTVKIVALAFGTAHTFFMSASATDNLVLT